MRELFLKPTFLLTSSILIVFGSHLLIFLMDLSAPAILLIGQLAGAASFASYHLYSEIKKIEKSIREIKGGSDESCSG